MLLCQINRQIFQSGTAPKQKGFVPTHDCLVTTQGCLAATQSDFAPIQSDAEAAHDAFATKQSGSV